MKNLELAELFLKIADILEFQGIDWKPQAYRKAARSIESLSRDIEEVWKQGKLRELPGIGEAIAGKIEEFITTGKLEYYDQLKKESKIDLEGLLAIPGLGPKKIKVLYQQLKVKSVADLEKALQQQKVRKLEGFGEETEKKLLAGVQFVKSKPKRFLYARAEPIVADIISCIWKVPGVSKVEVAGSFRRGKETVGDLDILVVSGKPVLVMDRFTALPDVAEVLAKGKTKSTIRFRNGLQVDLRVVQEKEFGSTLNYFIGSKEHNIELRKLALRKGYTLSEYGLFTSNGKKWLAGRMEEDIYQKLGLQFIPPELRENLGEIPAAQQTQLPNLVEMKDISGVFHTHSTWSDGNATVLEMSQQAEHLGFKFISFNDHAGPMGITRPLNEKRLRGYLKEIEQVRKKIGIHVFSGVEVDILKNGSLAMSRKALREVDVVIASVHLAPTMKEPEMTKRVCKALEEPAVTILGHPTDRILNERPPLSLNLQKVYERAQQNNIFLEINSSPGRMDLDGDHIKAAKEISCRFALSADAHDLHHLAGYKYGVLSARRGWAEKKDILNCWPMAKVEKALQR